MSKNKWHKIMDKDVENDIERDIADDSDEGGSEGGQPAITNPSRDEFEEQLNAAEAKANDNWEKLLRLQAEFDNVRKRSQRDLEQAHKYALEKIALELLPVVDSLERGLSQMNDDQLQVYRAGAELTLKQLHAVLEKFSIKEVNPLNQPFDPALHEAMGVQEADVAPNTVINVLQKGYVLHDRLLRPALVMVSKAPA
jgi:molecular chaperone GrpE